VFACTQPLDNGGLLGLENRWNEYGGGLADSLIGGIAKEALGGGVPRGNDAIRAFAQNRSREDSTMAASRARACSSRSRRVMSEG